METKDEKKSDEIDRNLIVLSLDQELNQKLTKRVFDKMTRTKKHIVTINNLPKLENYFESILALEAKYTDEEYQVFLKMLKPKGKLTLARTNTVFDLTFRLKSNGFLLEKHDIEFTTGRKPDYEIGSALELKEFWSEIVKNDSAANDLIDENDLIEYDDYVKPKAEELRVCASTKQRKACANCNCGLKEELEKEEIEKIRSNTQNVKSSCGNCYLGDAFRCESCPYRGLPAFKPGEKVILTNIDDL
ncbi:SHC SH2 domain-binding protein [Sarcoptes scabiei]|nr:SHC SH2 domain-binding protein [Sarcoptes scabiei]